ncbi:MAG TPA: patatin-like phospholipase family protein [Burkholderiaceae bacterium]|nr:patatin-like phospholipase family protein [Burkholderiaceae bacterium]
MGAPETPTATAPAASSAAARPRVGLVLSGGGARGLAHVGVLKVLEEARIPIDAIAGTSMGAIVGGLYASGMRADALERELNAVRWDQVFANRVERPELSQRRKEEDFEFSTAIELGVRNGELRAPQGAVSSRGLESLLRRFTLPVHQIQRFDELPIPFRAVATDMETGQPVVLDRGDLAQALRSSMSVPGVFSPIEVDSRMLGDGGLVDNVPIGVARSMKVDLLIVVNIGTPLAGRETLGSAFGLTQQMINILTEQNVQRSLATLQAGDILIAPDLGELTARDFDRSPELIALGVAGARAAVSKLASLALDADAYAAWHVQHRVATPPAAPLAFVRIEGAELSNPDRLAAMLGSRAGQPFDRTQADNDTRRLAASGDYTRTDYQLVRTEQGEGLVFELEEKPWGPNYLRIGMDLNTDFSGHSAFNLKLSHNRHWLTRSGTEWRNRLQIGEEPLLYTELYQPLNWTASPANDWFASGYAGIQRRPFIRYAPDTGNKLAEFSRETQVLGVDIGQPWGEFGEIRFGPSHTVVITRPELLGADYTGATGVTRVIEDGVRARVVIDQLDYANFPLTGYRFEGLAWAGSRSGDLTGAFRRVETQGTWVGSWGVHTFNAYARVNVADIGQLDNVPRYTLGGFHELSGYYKDQLEGNVVALLRFDWYMRQAQTLALTRGLFIGATLELGNAWLRRSDIRDSELRSGMSVYLGADTGIGPLYFGLTYAPRGTTGLALIIGRP